MTDDQIDEIVKSRKFFQTELIEDQDGDHNHDINDDDDIRHDSLSGYIDFGDGCWRRNLLGTTVRFC